VHTVNPEKKINISNGYPDNIGAIYITLYGDMIIPPSPTPTPTDTPSPSIPPITDNTTNRGSLDSNSTRPQPYIEGSNQGLLNNTLPSNSTGFREFANGMGYNASVAGYLAIIQDYMIYYLLLGIGIFIAMLSFKKGG
jgi:hypothetical protein